MTFALTSNPSQSEISNAINYLLANFGPNLSADPNNGQISGPSGVVIAYLYQYIAVKYADSFDGTLNFSNSPTGRTYYGLRNTNSSVESTNPADYIWFLAAGGFGSTKFLFYQTNGGRQINFFVGTTAPNSTYLQETGPSIDLDVVTTTTAYNTAAPSIYIWTASSTPPTRPSTTSTYTWATGAYTAPSGWTTEPITNTTAGSVLWAITIPLVVNANTVTSVLDWANTSYPLYAFSSNGAAGTPGTAGANGISALTAYRVQAQNTAAPATPSNTTGPTAPSGWSLTAPTVSVGDVLWYTFGRYNSSSATLDGVPANQTAWGTPTAASIFQDIRSDNWNGTTPPTYGVPASYGTTGYYISRSTGNCYFNNGIFRGDITGASGSFSGSLNAATGTFAGALSGATGTFSGSLSAATGTFSGALSGATGTFSGALSAATGSFTGNITGTANINISGDAKFLGDNPTSATIPVYDSLYLIDYSALGDGTTTATFGNARVGLLGTAVSSGSIWNAGVVGYATNASSVSGSVGLGVVGSGRDIGGYFSSYTNAGVGLVCTAPSSIYSAFQINQGKFNWGSYSIAQPAGSTTTFLRNDGQWTTVDAMGGYDASSWARIFPCNSGTANAAGAGINILGSGSTGIVSAYVGTTGSGNTVTLDVRTTSPSDVRLKEEITNSDLGLAFVKQLRPVSYKLKADPKHQKGYGFIADEVEELIESGSSLVYFEENWQVGEETGFKTIHYPSYVAILTKAIQELSAEVESLKAQSRT